MGKSKKAIMKKKFNGKRKESKKAKTKKNSLKSRNNEVTSKLDEEKSLTTTSNHVPSTLGTSNWEKFKDTIPDRKKDKEDTPTYKVGEINEGDTSSEPSQPLIIENGFKGETKAVAIDCEMVGVGFNGLESSLARVSIVNFFGHVLYDEYVKPLETIVDYRTEFSGIRPENLIDAKEFFVVQQEVADLIKDKILVGHALINDLHCLFIEHPKQKIRDTSKYKPFHKIVKTKRPKLKILSSVILKRNIQGAEHSSVEDAQATMRLYAMHRNEWEKSIQLKALPGKFRRPEADDFVSDMLGDN